jgi:hypothetical protein
MKYGIAPFANKPVVQNVDNLPGLKPQRVST